MNMWLTVGILTYLIVVALFLLFFSGANRTDLEDEVEDWINRLKNIPGTPPLRSGSSKEEARNADVLRKTGTGS